MRTASGQKSFYAVKLLSQSFTKTFLEMSKASYPVSERFAPDTALVFSTKTALALDPRADANHIMWIYVDRDYTKATIAIERHAWEASGEVMIWTEMPDDQLDGMTVDVFDSSFVHDKWSMMCHKTQVSELSVQAKNAFDSYMNNRDA